MGYADWQLRRIRSALTAHHELRHEDEERVESWRYLAERVNAYHQVQASASDLGKFGERIRQLVEGVPKKGALEELFGENYIEEHRKKNKNKSKKDKKAIPRPTEEQRRQLIREGKWHFPEPKRLPEIVDFITDGESGFLSAASLQNFAPHLEAPLRLIEYLDPHYAERDPASLSFLKGSYRSRRRISVCKTLKHVQSEIDLSNVGEFGIIHLTGIEEWFDVSSWEHLDSLQLDERDEARKDHYQYTGWGIVSPDQSLLMFLKLVPEEECQAAEGQPDDSPQVDGLDEDENRTYLSLAFLEDDRLATDEPVQAIFLLEHEAPEKIPVVSAPSHDDAVSAFLGQPATGIPNEDRKQDLCQKLENNIVIFERVSEYLTEKENIPIKGHDANTGNGKKPENGDPEHRFRRAPMKTQAPDPLAAEWRYARYARRTVPSRRMDQETYLSLETCFLTLEETDPAMTDYLSGKGVRTPERLAKEFMYLVSRGFDDAVKAILDAGFPINYQHPPAGRTALHKAASRGNTEMVDFLANYEGCDLLLRDKQGRLADEVAFCAAKNEELAKELLQKEAEQARRRGLTEFHIRPDCNPVPL